MSRRIFCTVLLVAVAIFGLLFFSGILSAQGRSDGAFERVKEVQERHTNDLIAMDGVEGTAIGFNENDRLAVKVFTARPGVGGIPKSLDGVPVQVVVSGKFYALPMPDTPPGLEQKEDEVDPTIRFDRPVPIGVSTGNEGECSAGTIGCRVTDGTDVYALSNNHVYALENVALVGSNVLQPGRYDTYCETNEDDVIGTLFDFEPIVFYDTENPPDPIPTNEIDAAIAEIIIDETTGPRVDKATPDDGYGTPSSTIFGGDLLDLEVQKYGRTTGLTKGTITEVNFIGNIGYSSGTARFVGQIVIIAPKGRFSRRGDSGSLIVTDDEYRNPVGLLFAGGGRWTIANPIDAVLEAFEVTIDDDAAE